MVKKLFFYLLIIVFSIIALKGLWGPNFYTSHDGQSHLARLYQLDLVLKDGQFPPRWAGQFAGGTGYPVFVFAYPLPYWIGEVFHLVGFNLAVSTKLVFVLFYLLSGFAMFNFVKEVFKNDWIAFLSCMLWIWAPYRFVKIYVTASLGEAAAFAFIPLILWFIYRIFQKNTKKDFILLTVSLSGLYLCHLITFFIFFPLIFLFFLWCLKNSEIKKIAFRKIILSFIISTSIVSFYLIPAVYEIRFTRYREILTNEYYKQFVDFKKLLYSPWGYGAPKFGPGELSLQVGIAQWLAIGLFFAVIMWLFIKRIKHKNHSSIMLGIIFFANFVLAIFLMLQISKPVWDLVTPLQSVDTPWRYLSLAVFTSSFLAGWSISVLSKNKTIFLVFTAGLIFLAVYGNRNNIRINQQILYPDDYFKTYYWVGSGWDEYRPKWMYKTYSKPFSKKVEILEGNCEISGFIKKSNLITFKANCNKESLLKVESAYYPGWLLKINNIDKTGLLISNLDKSLGFIQFDVPSGQNNIKIEFKETELRKISDIISMISLGLLFIVK